MVTSAPAARIGASGSGSRIPPSASTRPLSTYGVITPGIAMDARIATSTGPRWNQTDRPAARSVATAVYGIRSPSMGVSPRISRTLSRIFSAWMAPGADSDTSSSRSTSSCVNDVAQRV